MNGMALQLFEKPILHLTRYSWLPSGPFGLHLDSIYSPLRLRPSSQTC